MYPTLNKTMTENLLWIIEAASKIKLVHVWQVMQIFMESLLWTWSKQLQKSIGC